MHLIPLLAPAPARLRTRRLHTAHRTPPTAHHTPHTAHRTRSEPPLLRACLSLLAHPAPAVYAPALGVICKLTQAPEAAVPMLQVPPLLFLVVSYCIQYICDRFFI
jgi:hypothetical protein